MELCSKSAVFLIRNHQRQLISSQGLLTDMLDLRRVLSGCVSQYRTALGTNIAGLRLMDRIAREKQDAGLFVDDQRMDLMSASAGQTEKK